MILRPPIPSWTLLRLITSRRAATIYAGTNTIPPGLRLLPPRRMLYLLSVLTSKRLPAVTRAASIPEAIRPDHHNHNDMVNSVWLKNIGEDYVELAFRATSEADPSALLTYNDYGIEADTPEQERKRESILAMLRRVRKEHVPIHALGVQSHLRPHGDPFSWNGLNTFLKEIRKLKMEVFVTELDVDDSALPADIPERDRLVAEVYRSYLENILRHESVKAVLTWCLSDRDTWLQGFRPRKEGLPQRPLPFDADLNPKPAFFALRDALSTR